MALETGTFISDLVATNPASTDPKSQGDDHLRLLKSTVKTTFPNVSGAVTPTHLELNYVAGVTSAIQEQLNAEITNRTNADALKANLASPTFTGTVTIPSGASIAGFAPLASPALTGVPSAPTATIGTATTQIATTAFVVGTSLTSSLPGQAGNAGKFITTDGTNPSWGVAVDPASAQTLTNKTIGGATNNVEARSLKSATTTVSVSAATAPTSGQVLTATSGTAANWQTLPAFPAPTGTGTGSITSPERSIGTTYTNSGSTTRWVMFTGTFGGIGSGSEVFYLAAVNGTSLARNSMYCTDNPGGQPRATPLVFPVPAGGTYVITSGGWGSGSVLYWSEYQ